MGLSKAEREAGYRAVPMPSEHTSWILRRVAHGFLLVTNATDGGPAYTYEDGTLIRDSKGKPITKRAINRMIKQGWLLPIKGESLLKDGPPQRYRARNVDDGPLPRWRMK